MLIFFSVTVPFFSASRNPIYRATAPPLIFSLGALCCLLLAGSEAQLTVGFYSSTCPKAESIVASVVKQAASSNPRIPAILLRLHFHDCYVEGCDGSILIENGDDAEKTAFGHQGVEGFEEIDRAKAELEAGCPGVVSCADIVALAARDAVALSKGVVYEVQTGRRDGRVSSRSLAADVPDVDDSIQLLKSKFRKKGLSDKDLVLLSAAHTIGTTACFFMDTRLYNFNGKPEQSDPAINPPFLQKLKAQCPKGGDVNVRIPLDIVSSEVFDDQILRNVRDGVAVISSDARLYDDEATRLVVDSYVVAAGSSSSSSGSPFERDFAESMVKMGQLGVKTGSQGEIRRNCRAFN
ncbi:peroxidase 43 [Diospyros lotus]|uniref:peroxidase 43 n=1 Tax=Diospyros lotus TaxID=55363 RepID=UPI00225AA909|nr:peroxidase 43 [Diospyros lotus]